MWIKGVVAFALMASAVGCTALPNSGPTVGELDAAQKAGAGGLYEAANGVAVVFVDVNAAIAQKAFRNTGSDSLSGRFADRRPAPDVRIAPGDTLTVTIFESSAGGLFSPPTNSVSMNGGNFVTLPLQVVGKDGKITIPYAGPIQASGRNISDIQAEAVEKLRRRAIEPQVIITQGTGKSNLITVSGEVAAPTRISATTTGERILDALAAAGGSKHPAHETFITLQRGGQRASVPLQRIVSNPNENIYVRPGDTVIAVRQQRHFLAFGASGRNGQFAFELDTLSVAEGVAKAGGLLDERADPAMVFLYRTEDRRRIESYGIDLSTNPASHFPVLYRFDLRDPAGLVLAKTFPMVDKDALYIANASSTDFMKAVGVVRGATGIARDVDAIRRGLTY